MKKIIITIEEDDNNVQQIPSIPYYPNGISSNPYGMRVDPCEHCQNNPKNNPLASGVCCCALPDLYRIIY